jgi:hypothetical protein
VYSIGQSMLIILVFKILYLSQGVSKSNTILAFNLIICFDQP